MTWGFWFPAILCQIENCKRSHRSEDKVIFILILHYRYHVYLKYWSRQAWANSEDPGQILQNVASGHSLHYLPLIQQFFLDTPAGSKWPCPNFRISMVQSSPFPLQSTLFIPTLDTMTKFVIITIWMSGNLRSRGDSCWDFMQEYCTKTSSNICLGYLLELPHWGNSNKYPKHMFCE